MRSIFITIYLAFILTISVQTNGQNTGLNDKYPFAHPIQKATIDDAGFNVSPYNGSENIKILPKGTLLSLIGVYDGYYRVRLGDTFGFVHYVFIDGDAKRFSVNKYPHVGRTDEYDYENEPNSIVFYGKVEYESYIRKQPNDYSAIIDTIPEGGIAKITHFNIKYWSAKFNNHSGYLNKEAVLRTAKTYKDVQKPSSGAKTTKELFSESDALLKESKKLLRGSPKTYRSANSQYYIRGPRGGCYYLTGSGRKQYVDRSLCD